MNRHLGTLAAALALALAATAARAADPEPRQHCFPANGSWTSWSAPGNGDVLYLRVHINDIYRVDLTPGSHAYKSPGYFLVNEVRGSGRICSAIDLDLTLASDLRLSQAADRGVDAQAHPGRGRRDPAQGPAVAPRGDFRRPAGNAAIMRLRCAARGLLCDAK